MTLANFSFFFLHGSISIDPLRAKEEGRERGKEEGEPLHYSSSEYKELSLSLFSEVCAAASTERILCADSDSPVLVREVQRERK